MLNSGCYLFLMAVTSPAMLSPKNMNENPNVADATEFQDEPVRKLYELMFMVPGSANAEEAKDALARTKKEIVNLGGKIENTEEWGRRDLAYPIKKEYQGYYFVVHYYLQADKAPELEDTLRLDRSVIRHLVVIRPADVPAVDYSGVSTGYNRPPESEDALLGEEVEEKEDESLQEDIMNKPAAQKEETEDAEESTQEEGEESQEEEKEEVEEEENEEKEEEKPKQENGNNLDKILDDLENDFNL